MKRQYFDISLNGAVVATTFAWNAAIREIERLVRERAREVARRSLGTARSASLSAWGERSVAVGGLYKLVDSLSEGTDKWHFTHGHRTWRSAHETLRYDIKLRGSIPTC